MHKPVKYVEKAVTIAAKGAWAVFERANRIKQNPSPKPKWSDKPLLKSYQKTKPPLGWPRTTDSLCPRCVPEIRQQILDGKLPVEVLSNEKVGEIKAQIIERDGKILMVKDCEKHGHFEDVMSIDTDFSRHLEEVFPGRDIVAHNVEKLHHHGSSTVKYGRGSVLTIDLTNRCNMMCDPCFMDANQVGFVHELSWEDIKTMLDNAITIKPRRQMSVQFATPARWDTTACKPQPTESNSRRVWNSPSKPLKLECATPICNSTESATPRTPTEKSATSST